MQIRQSAGVGSVQGQQESLSALKKTNRTLHKILNSLATGLRINKASDDAAGLSISEQLRSQIRGLKMASQNITDAESALNIADSTSSRIADILQRQRELAISALNDTLNDTQRQVLEVEYQQLNKELTRITESAQFNTQKVANGTGLVSGNAKIQAGANTEESVTIPLVNLSSSILGIDSTSISDSTKASNALKAIDNALDIVNKQRSAIGSMTNRLQSAQNNLLMAQINTQAAESVIRDQDMAMGVAELTRQRLLHEGAIKAFSRFNEVSANHLFKLLQ